MRIQKFSSSFNMDEVYDHFFDVFHEELKWELDLLDKCPTGYANNTTARHKMGECFNRMIQRIATDEDYLGKMYDKYGWYVFESDNCLCWRKYICIDDEKDNITYGVEIKDNFIDFLLNEKDICFSVTVYGPHGTSEETEDKFETLDHAKRVAYNDLLQSVLDGVNRFQKIASEVANECKKEFI